MEYKIGKCYLWEGGKCPLPDGSKADIIFSSGRVAHNDIVGDWSWRAEGGSMNIVAFIPRSMPAREKVSGWVNVYKDGVVFFVYKDEESAKQAGQSAAFRVYVKETDPPD